MSWFKKKLGIGGKKKEETKSVAASPSAAGDQQGGDQGVATGTVVGAGAATIARLDAHVQSTPISGRATPTPTVSTKVAHPQPVPSAVHPGYGQPPVTGSVISGNSQGTPNSPSMPECENCEEQPAAFYCPMDKMNLCAQCDAGLHKSHKGSLHKRVALSPPPAAANNTLISSPVLSPAATNATKRPSVNAVPVMPDAWHNDQALAVHQGHSPGRAGPSDEDQAARVIQRSWRGRKARAQQHTAAQPNTNASTLDEDQAARVIQRSWREHKQPQHVPHPPSAGNVHPEEDQAARVIQRNWRHHNQRRKTSRPNDSRVANTAVVPLTGQQDEDQAARVIQRNWRRHTARRGAPHHPARSSSPTRPSANIKRSDSTQSMESTVSVSPMDPELVSELWRTFQYFDQDKNGTMDMQEISHFLKVRGYNYSEDYVTYLVQRVFDAKLRNSQDRSSNDLLFEEFCKFMHIFMVCDEAVRDQLEAVNQQYGLGIDRDDRDAFDVLTEKVRFVQDRLDLTEVHRFCQALEEEEMEMGADPVHSASGSPYGPHSPATSPAHPKERRLSVPIPTASIESDARVHERLLAQSKQLSSEDLAQRSVNDLPPRLHPPGRHGGSGHSSAHSSAAATPAETPARSPRSQHGGYGPQSPSRPDQFGQPRSQLDHYGQPQYGQPKPQHQQPHPDYKQPDQQLPYQAGRGQGSPRPDANQGGQPQGSPPTHRNRRSADRLHSTRGSISVAPLSTADVRDEDELYIRENWSRLLEFFKKNEHDELDKSELGQAMRAMGLDPSDEQLDELFTVADYDNSGSINFAEFRDYYNELFNKALQNVELSRLQKVFEQYDEDGNGDVSHAEFRHLLTNTCSDLSRKEIDRLIAHVDVDSDGYIQFHEFVQFIREPSGAGRRLLIKIVRSLLPSPLEHLVAFKELPSSFRPSVLAAMADRKDLAPSAALTPVLDKTGLLYENFHLDPTTGCLMPTPPQSVQDREEKDPQAGREYVTLEVQLLGAEGIPMPSDEHRGGILGRHVRVALYEVGPVANLHVVKAHWDSRAEDQWKFTHKNDSDFHGEKFTVKTHRSQTYLFFEFCLVMRRPRRDASDPNGTDDAMDHKHDTDTATGFQEHKNPLAATPDVTSRIHAKNDFMEMTCGFATCEILKDEAIAKTQTVKLTVSGGTLEARADIEDKDVHARRGGLGGLWANLKGKPTPTLTVKIRPLHQIGSFGGKKRLRKLLSYLPPDVIVPTSTARIVRMFYEVLADQILQPVQPLRQGIVQNLPVKLFRTIVDHPDMLQAFVELWDDRRSNLSNSQRRDLPNGSANPFIKQQFRAAVLRFWAIASSYTLPAFIMGVTDEKRLSLLRSAMWADPLLSFSSDSMVSGNRTALVTQALGHVEFAHRMLYTPFHTREVAFDHSKETIRFQMKR